MDSSSNDLDPRIQVELENLNTATDEINKLEIELEEANATFNILSNESTRRLKLLIKKLGSCIEKSRPYYEAVEKARVAQIECQAAAVKFQRANEIYAAAKETVALAEQRFMSNSHEWQFDNAWQEMLNHATIKVMEAETQKTESGLEHQKRALVFTTAELKVQQLEEKLKRHIHKSRPYFEENQICQDQLKTQKGRIKELQGMIQCAKTKYATALRKLESISEEIHKQRGDLPTPPGPREPGVGAELSPDPIDEQKKMFKQKLSQMPDYNSADYDRFPDLQPFGSMSTVAMSTSEKDEGESEQDVDEDEMENEAVEDDADLEELRKKVKVLAIRPVEGGEGQQEQDVWESELNATVDKLDHLMMLREFNKGSGTSGNLSFPNTPVHGAKSLLPNSPKPIKLLKGGGQLPTSNCSLNELSVAKLMPYVLPYAANDPFAAATSNTFSKATPTSQQHSLGSTKEHKRKMSI